MTTMDRIAMGFIVAALVLFLLALGLGSGCISGDGACLVRFERTVYQTRATNGTGFAESHNNDISARVANELKGIEAVGANVENVKIGTAK